MKYLCPCGCKRPVEKNNSYWATEKCGEKARRTKGMYMPANGEWRQHSRLMKKINKLKIETSV